MRLRPRLRLLVLVWLHANLYISTLCLSGEALSILACRFILDIAPMPVLCHDTGMDGNDKNPDLPVSEKSGRVRSGKARMDGLTPEQRKELARWAAEKRWGPRAEKPQSNEFIEKPSSSEILIYQSDDQKTRIDVQLEDGTVWLSQLQMADLFQRDKSVISRHIQSVYDEGELFPQGTVAKRATVQTEGAVRYVGMWTCTIST